MKKFSKILSLILSFICITTLSIVAYGSETLPDNAKTYTDSISFMKIFTAEISDGYKDFSNDGNVNNSTIKLFGKIPVKAINLEKTTRRYVIPGGELIGIRLKTEGVLIVGMENFESDEGVCCPALKAGIKTGDILMKINGKNIYSNEDLSEHIEKSKGKNLNLLIKRQEKNMNIILTPKKSLQSDKYKSGMWIRDSTGGIGTLSYRDPANGTIASLGHGIYDVDTKTLIPVHSGTFLSAEMTGIRKGKSGTPGEITGIIGDKKLGDLFINCDNGIYGTLTSSITNEKYYPVAGTDEIETGPAKIISSVNGDRKSFYDIEIKKFSGSDKNKSMLISVTDPELIEKTGGIIQGMSGSPVIQNGMFIGAVTHVFLNDPTKGYAISAETMLDTADLLNKSA